jgi:hypothetical protein
MTDISPEPKPQASAAECQIISEKQFLRDHTYYSAISSWLFAIAGATNIGVLCAFSSKVLTAAEQGKPLFKSNDPNVVPVLGNKKYNRIAIGMTAFGAVCMAISNWLESKKVVTEWQLGAGKLQRKANIAEKELASMETAQQSSDAEISASPCKNWVNAVQAKDPIEHLAQRVRHG